MAGKRAAKLAEQVCSHFHAGGPLHRGIPLVGRQVVKLLRCFGEVFSPGRLPNLFKEKVSAKESYEQNSSRTPLSQVTARRHAD